MTKPECKVCGSKTRKLNKPGPRCTSCWRGQRTAASKAAHERRVQSLYGLAPGEYDQLYEYQGGVCALCERSSGKTRRLAVDHDHETGAVRGLLCQNCNYNVLGRAARDDPEFFRRGVAYLNIPPYEQMQIDAALPGVLDCKYYDHSLRGWTLDEDHDDAPPDAPHPGA